MPNRPNRASSRLRTSAVTSASPTGPQEPVDRQQLVSSSSRGARASAASAVYSACRSVRPVCASSPATATTFWHSPRTAGSAR